MIETRTSQTTSDWVGIGLIVIAVRDVLIASAWLIFESITPS
jgi:hypothetical protein